MSNEEYAVPCLPIDALSPIPKQPMKEIANPFSHREKAGMRAYHLTVEHYGIE